MMIDCEGCAVRGAACAGCVMTFLTIEVRSTGVVRRATASAVDLDDAERAAIDVLASSGLVPPLRLLPRERAG
ncbi:MAG: hypothetical protein H7269_10440 [Cellulomonas sp.]|nr:hypothetical protein [Cellulomonas sp.]